MNGGPLGPWPRPRPTTIEEAYTALRAECANLEELIEATWLTDKERKRLDKAVVVVKAGIKIAKKARKKTNVVPLRVLEHGE